jgi:hypothetical protein
MKMLPFASILTLVSMCWSSLTCQAQDRKPPRTIDESDTVLVDEVRFKGKIYDGENAVAEITIIVETGSLKVSGGTVAEFQSIPAFSGQKVKPADSTSIEVTETGAIVISRFPLGDPDAREDSKAELSFDAAGKPAKGARKLSGTIKTSKGEVLKFLAHAQ